MKKNVIRMVFLLSMIFVQRTMNAQVVYPPNYSFEDDSLTYKISPWKAVGNFDLSTSVNMHFAPNGKYFFSLASYRNNNVLTNSKLWIKFPINERVRFLNFASMFYSQFEFYKFRLKLMMTKFNPYYKWSYPICNIDTLMDTICNVRDYREDWFFHKVDLKKYYVSNEVPDTCYLEISCDIDRKIYFDYIQYLDLDNFFLTGNVDAQVSALDQPISNCDVRVYPNPSNGLLNMDLSAVPDVMQLDVISMDGRSVLTQNNLDEIVELDLSALTKGLYLLKITNSDNTQIFKEIVIE